jgi:hypothetical protein
MPFCAPSIVYSQSFLDQTSALSPTVIFTPTADGLFRINAAVSATGAPDYAAGMDCWWDGSASSGSASAYVEFVGQTNGTVGIGGKFSSDGTASNLFIGREGVAIKISSAGIAPIPTYDLYVTLEQLA